ncbi:MAG: branched-chain amino acid ABC transporter permease, partial [Planctomycetota bacterium]
MAELRIQARELRPSLVPTAALSVMPFATVLLLAIVAQLVLAPWMVANHWDFQAKIGLDIATSIVLAVSLTMVNGFTGQFSIGHAAFMAVGAYASAMIVYYGSFRLLGNVNMNGGLVSSMIFEPARTAPILTLADGLFALSLIVGGLVAAICGYVVGLPSLRLKGDYLAIVTLGFGEIVRVLVQSQTTEVLSEGSSVTQEHLDSISAWSALTTDDTMMAEQIAKVPWYLWPRYTGGALGFGGLPSYTSLFWVVLAAGVTLVVAFRLKRSSFGRAFLSIREDEIAANSMGVNVTAYKVRAFVIAAFFAGIAGGLYAHTTGVQLKADELGFQKSFDIIIMVVLGGLGSISGASVAAIIVTILPELLRKPETLGDCWPWGLGLLVVGIAIAIGMHRAKRSAALGKALITTGAVALFLSAIALLAAHNKFDIGPYRMVLFAIALVAMMLLRPQGLFG